MQIIMSGLMCSTHDEQAKYVLVVTAAGSLRVGGVKHHIQRE
jgi:hypothetical protein